MADINTQEVSERTDLLKIVLCLKPKRIQELERQKERKLLSFYNKPTSAGLQQSATDAMIYL